MHIYRSPGDTNSSRENILQAIREFQQRTQKGDEGAVFVFFSALWDVYRYIDNFFDSE